MGNREALLEAAVVCLREQGYGGTTARDVSGAAQVSLGAIRYHFGSMEGLLDEAVAECCRRWARGFARSLADLTAAQPDTGLLTEMDRLHDIFESEHTLLTGFVEAFAHAQRSASTRARLAALYDELRASLTQALDAATGGAPSGDGTAASILIAIADGLMVQWLRDPTRRPAPTVLRHVITGLINGITAQAPAATP